ncbi:hypothetical protein HPP92_007960 [Vanilla planifolia]|uniref:Lactoylglutathione lyase n=1 Tax=Vanilla planifolia TaxID=51239 RepID=A0A835RS80_VANPL|nr:hypothetical protein HPP92_007960 [Vanilla planifolia]
MVMVRIFPMAANSSLRLSSFRPLEAAPRCRSSFTATRHVLSIAPSRRAILFHLASDAPHAQFFGIKSLKLKAEMNDVVVNSAGNLARVSTTVSQEDSLDWVKKDNRRLLHVVYRVGDLEKTIKFYTECLGMKLLRKRDIPEERYTNAFLGYGPEDSHFVAELTYNYGVDKYDLGTGFGHFGVAVEDVAKAVDLIKAKGGKVARNLACKRW